MTATRYPYVPGCTGLPFHQLSGAHLPVFISVTHWACRKTRAVRQSILFSVARIFWSARSLRLKVIAIALVFLVLYGALVAQRAWQYGHDFDRYNRPDKNEQKHAHLTHPVAIFELISKSSGLNHILTTDDNINSGLRFWYNRCNIRLASSMGHKACREGTNYDTGSTVDQYHCDDLLDFPSCLPTQPFQEYLENRDWSWGMNCASC